MGRITAHVALHELFGDAPFRPMDRSFSVQRSRAVHPNMYYKIEWAKQVTSIYRRMLMNGEVDGKKHGGFVTPYPSPPKERHQSKGQREARARGAAAGMVTKRARMKKKKKVQEVVVRRKPGPRAGWNHE